MEEGDPWLEMEAPAPRGYWLKRKLRLYFGPRQATKDSDQEDHSGHDIFWTRKRLVVALLIILALVIMGLLLLWNYQCIVVWHMCHAPEEYPVLGTFRAG
ncbi:hypothetical protein SRHO_G00224980 [Serrasalmus rhombeus]